MSHPKVSVRPYFWKTPGGSDLAGVGIVESPGNWRLHGFLTHEEARAFADTIHDICDQHEQHEQQHEKEVTA